MAKITITIEDVEDEAGKPFVAMTVDGEGEDPESPAAEIAMDILDYITQDAEGLSERESDTTKH